MQAGKYLLKCGCDAIGIRRWLLEPFGILKASWSGLGRLSGQSEKPLGRSWDGLGSLLGALGRVLGALGMVLEAS